MKRNKDGTFTSEGVRGNTFAKGNPPNSTSFKKGINTGRDHNCWKGGVQHNINDCTYIRTAVGKRERRPRLEYVKHFGEIPKGFVIVHKDGNKDNDAPENLEAISRAESLRRNRL